MHVHAYSSLSLSLVPLLREVLCVENYDKSFNHVLLLVMHSIRRATSPPNFAAPRDGTFLASCARTCNVFSRTRRADLGAEISGYRRDKGSRVSKCRYTVENPAKIGSSYRIGLQKRRRKILREYQNFNLEFSISRKLEIYREARARDSVYVSRAKDRRRIFFLDRALTKKKKKTTRVIS